jgi:hypothetical protein
LEGNGKSPGDLAFGVVEGESNPVGAHETTVGRQRIHLPSVEPTYKMLTVAEIMTSGPRLSGREHSD